MKKNITTIYTVEGERLDSDLRELRELREKLEREPEVKVGNTDVDVYSHFVNKGYISMVGRYYLSKSNTLWCSFPKYYLPHQEGGKIVPDDTDKKTMTQIIDVMDKLRQNDRNIDEFSAEYDFSRQKKANKVSPFALSEYLIRDYTANGIYVRQKTEQGSHVRGKTSWPLTIKKEKPVISCHSVVYGKIWKKHRIADYDNPITQLHICVLREASEVQGLKGLVNDISFPAIDMQISSMLSDDRKRASAAKIIQKEMSQVFTDRDISLLKALLAWCEQPTKNYKFAGSTNSFNLVWEWVNDAVFGKAYDNDAKKSEDLTYYLYQDKDNDPIGYKCPGQNSQIDTLYYNPNNKQLLVYDAKYYCPVFKDGKVSGAPDNKDSVRKQVIYFEGLKRDLGKENVNEKNSRNVFLLPMNNKAGNDFSPIRSANIDSFGCLYDHVGFVESPGFGELAEKLVGRKNIPHFRVELYMVYPDVLYDMYLQSQEYKHKNEVPCAKVGKPFTRYMWYKWMSRKNRRK